jgi:YD repeat-containing protein
MHRALLLLPGLLLACESTPPPPTTRPITDAPLPVTASSSREVVANGSCWILGKPPEVYLFANTRWVYDRGRLQRIDGYEADRKTQRSTEVFERDARGRVNVEISMLGNDPPEELSRTHRTWDESGRVHRTTWTRGGEPGGTSEHTYDAAGHLIGVTSRKANGESSETTWRWVATKDGGWTVTQGVRHEYPATRDRPAEVVEYSDNETVILDSRGRPLEERSGGVCRHFLWDDEDRCIQATIFDGCTSNSQFPPTLRVTIRRTFGDEPREATITHEYRDKRTTVRHVVDEAGNVIEIQRADGNTHFEYEGQFRNAMCHDVDRIHAAEGLWPQCDISER